MQNGRQTCKNVYAMFMYYNWASILHTTVGGWVHGFIYLSPSWVGVRKKGKKEEETFVEAWIIRINITGSPPNLIIMDWKKTAQPTTVVCKMEAQLE